MTGSGTTPQDTAGQDLDQGIPLSCGPAITPLSVWTHCVSSKHFNVLIYKMEINNTINNRSYQEDMLED